MLQVISSSPGDLEPVFQTVLQNATRLCEAKFGNLLLADDAGFRIAANHGAPDQGIALCCKKLPLVLPRKRDNGKSTAAAGEFPDVPLARLVTTLQLVHIADITNEPAYVAGFGPLVSSRIVAGARSVLIVPMLNRHDVHRIRRAYLVARSQIVRWRIHRQPIERDQFSPSRFDGEPPTHGMTLQLLAD